MWVLVVGDSPMSLEGSTTASCDGFSHHGFVVLLR